MTNTPSYHFKAKVFISGTITALTGLHIGGSSTEMSIGGADLIVIRDPLTNRPYVPGSSLRGKMRSLLERARGEMTVQYEDADGKLQKIRRLSELAEPMQARRVKRLKSAGPSTAPDALASKLFGMPIDQQKDLNPEDINPQRLVVRDGFLLNAEDLEKARNTDMPMTEVKTEVAIDRITSAANPRQIERVPAGAKFDFEFILNLYGEDREEEYLKALFECMELLQDDYLGGHGSRGYGRVKLQVVSLTKKTTEDYRSNKPASLLNGVEVPASLRVDRQA